MEATLTRTRREILTGAAGAGAVALAPKALRAQDKFPSRTIRIIVPFPAGATTDMLARLFAQRMTETMGQSAVVENVGGGGGSIGADQVAKATPDGHTLLFHNITFTTTTSSLLYAKRARHDFDDFLPVSVGAYVPLLLLAHPSVPANNLKEFVAWAKETTTPLFYGSTGPGSILHLMAEVLKRDTGIKMDHVPFRGAAPLVTELLSGRIQFGGDQLSSSLFVSFFQPRQGLIVITQADFHVRGFFDEIEDPEAFNRALFEFFLLVDEGRCAPRDPRSAASGILGFRK